MAASMRTLKSFARKQSEAHMQKVSCCLAPPGTGKTHFTKCLGNEAGYELFILEVAELFGKFVGDSELMMKNAIDVIRANSPCCVCIDEVDKALAGVGGG